MEFNDKAGFAIRILSNRIGRKLSSEILRDVSGEITGLQGHVIGFIYNRQKDGDVFQKDIEDTFDIRRSTATKLLQLMEKNNLLIRLASSDDARMKKIILTDKALQFHDIITEKLRQMEIQIVKNITEEELSVFFSVLEKIEKNLQD